jgi:general stress protein 26
MSMVIGRSRTVTRAIAVVTALLAVGTRAAEPDGRSVQPPTRAEILAAAETVIARARYATFITLDRSGHPQARIVDPFPPERDLAIWIATNARSRKVAQVEAEPRVTLTYFDVDGQGYVTLLGAAQIVRDAAEKARRWKDEWEAFYDDRNRGDDYLLIRVVPARLEIVSEALGMRNDPETWRPVLLDLKLLAGLPACDPPDLLAKTLSKRSKLSKVTQ